MGTREEYAVARLDANVALRCMDIGHDNNYQTLRMLLNIGADTNLQVNFTEEDYYTCKQIAGPHGRTIVKMLCLKYGIKDLLKSCEER